MKYILSFATLSFLVFIPLTVFGDPGHGIVPTHALCDDTAAPFFQGRDLVHLFDHILSFAVYFSSVVATLMFAYAGFLYVTAAANPNNIASARKIFGTVFLGFVVILAAWLIVNVLMNVFLDTEKFKYPWNEIKCEEYVQITSPDLAQISALPPGNAKTEAEKRALLALFGVGVNNENACPPGQTTGCTTVAGVSARAIGYAGEVKKQCDAALGASCGVVVTGGSEGGHAGGTNPGSHGGGDKIDLRVTENLKSYVDTQVASGNFTKVAQPAFGSAQYVDTKTGAVWTYEKGKPGENDHYDICVENCSAPAARGS